MDSKLSSDYYLFYGLPQEPLLVEILLLISINGIIPRVLHNSVGYSHETKIMESVVKWTHPNCIPTISGLNQKNPKQCFNV